MSSKSPTRTLLEGQYHAFSSLLEEHGVPFPYLSEEELNALSDIDLQKMVRVLRDLARTPTS